jgi:tungstate transport system substrate-binding protein
MQVSPPTFLILLVTCVMLAAIPGCDEAEHGPPAALRVAVTTSTRDSGLLDALLPLYLENHDQRVDILAVGTGQALRLGEAGDVDVVLVHARAAEDAFMAAGHGIRREDVMYNTFEILGPPDDPAGIRGLSPVQAFAAMATSQAPFVSRGDNSGTHQRERALWDAAGQSPSWTDYVESGQGMGATLTMANQMSAYTLTDRGTFLNYRDKISLAVLVQSPEELANRYGVLVVNPAKHPAIQVETANGFVDFLISPVAQQKISEYRVGGEPLFYPMHPAE